MDIDVVREFSREQLPFQPHLGLKVSNAQPAASYHTYSLMGQQNQRFIRRANLQQNVQQHSNQSTHPQQTHQQNHPHQRYPYNQNYAHPHYAAHRQHGSNNERVRNQAESDMNRPQVNTTNAAAPPEKLDISDVRDPSDINQLSAKQLKIILTRNCVDFRGVFEKEVLREKVMLLWIDCNEKRNGTCNNDGSRDNSDDIDEKVACKICMEREINCVFLECGHMLTCITCGRKLAECPICRQNITRCVRTFKG